MKGLMLAPGAHAPTFGGDGLTIHYNMKFHAIYGEGAMLTSQYYPHKEVIFMTDAHGMIAWVLTKLRTVFPGIEHKAVGISNILIYWSNALAALVLFLILVRLKVQTNLAIIFAVLIALLSPQIHRQTCGHYALGFAYLLPTVILYLLQQRFKLSYLIFSLALIFLLIVIGLNNPYLLAISCSLMLAAAGIGILGRLWGKGPDWAVVLCWSGVAILSLLITMGILHQLEVVDDRVAVPAGFFTNVASVEGLLAPTETWIYKPIKALFRIGSNNFEARSFIGIAAILYLLISIVSRARGLKSKVFNKENNLAIILLGSIAVLVFSFGYPFILNKEWSVEHLGKIAQFRAPARFTWVFYFGITIVTAKYFSQLFEDLAFTRLKKWRVPMLAFIILLWGYDVHEFLQWRTKGKIHHNALSTEQLRPIKQLAKELKINTDNYQGMFLLPSEHGWTDKVYHEGCWRSNYEGYRWSIATGLPLINGKLSRVSLSHTLESMELISHPSIKRNILSQFPNDKKILILKAKEQVLTDGEEAFLSSGQTIYDSKDYVLLEIIPSSYAQELHKARVAILTQRPHEDSLTQILPQPLHYSHPEINKSHAFAGEGCLRIEAGETKVMTIPIDTSFRADTIELSFWNYVDASRYGGPHWKLEMLSNGQKVGSQNLWTLDVKETQMGWLRIAFDIPIEKGIDSIVLYHRHKFASFIDELLLKNKVDDIYYQNGQNLYFNNYQIEE